MKKLTAQENSVSPLGDELPGGRRNTLRTWLYSPGSILKGDRRKQDDPASTELPGASGVRRGWAVLLHWEMYVIVALAAFLRLYRINTTEFDDDQANIFRMAHDAVSHAHLVATSNVASIHIYNPPATIYFLMIPAMFSANPLGGAIFTAILAILAVLATYLFTCRYYGRLAGIVAAGIYGTAAVPVFYSRFLWNQNLLLLFVPLYMAVLFWGVVGRRKGWLGPAIFLLGLLVQLHESAALLIFPLLAALILAPKTLRWRDLLYGLIATFIIYAPYLLWFIATNFQDINYLLHTPVTAPTVFDDQVLLLYEHFLSPFDTPFTNTSSVLYPFVRFLSWLRPAMVLLVGAAMLVAFIVACLPGRNVDGRSVPGTVWGRVRGWWQGLRASPERCGLFLLLIWQVPLVTLLRHALHLQPHYLIVFMPGPFILVGFLLAKVVVWCRRWDWQPLLRYGVCALTVLIVVAQFVASTGAVLDTARGNFIDSNLSSPYYSDLASLQHAVNEADQLAQQQHINRVYISVDTATRSALRYLSTQMHTTSTVFDDGCLVLPDAAAGPAVLLVGPYSTMTSALATHFAQAKLVDEPKHLGGAPFRLYIVTPFAQTLPVRETFPQELQLHDTQAFSYNNGPWLIARWSFMHGEPASDNTTYSYNMPVISGPGEPFYAGSDCSFTAIRAGDQLLTVFPKPVAPQTHLNIKVQAYSSRPYYITTPLFLTFDTFMKQDTPWQFLRATDGKETIAISAS